MEMIWMIVYNKYSYMDINGLKSYLDYMLEKNWVIKDITNRFIYFRKITDQERNMKYDVALLFFSEKDKMQYENECETYEEYLSKNEASLLAKWGNLYIFLYNEKNSIPLGLGIKRWRISKAYDKRYFIIYPIVGLFFLIANLIMLLKMGMVAESQDMDLLFAMIISFVANITASVVVFIESFVYLKHNIKIKSDEITDILSKSRSVESVILLIEMLFIILILICSITVGSLYLFALLLSIFLTEGVFSISHKVREILNPSPSSV